MPGVSMFYRAQFAALGFKVTGTSPGGELVEVIELTEHPWFVAVQCHPEFKSKPTKAHPLFRGFVQASLARRELESIVKESPTLTEAHVTLSLAYYRLKRPADGNREKGIVEKLTAEAQAKQPGVKAQ